MVQCGIPRPSEDQSSLYFLNAAVARGDGEDEFLFFVKSGIIQGCPIVMDAPLRCMDGALARAEAGIVRACADDVGAALLSKAGIGHLRRPFAMAEGAVGLRLKPSKCKLVTCATLTGQAEVRRIRVWLVEKVPEWMRFGISDAGLYLGF